MKGDLETSFAPSKSAKLKQITLCLAVMLAITFCAMVALGVLYAIGTKEIQYEKRCETPECISSAYQVVQSLNTSADPCDDFFEYACGGWVAKNSIPKDSSRFGTFTKLRMDIQKDVKDLLEIENDDDIDAVVKAKTLYKACMDEDAREMKGVQPFKDLLTKLEGWPVLGSTRTFDLKTMLKKFFLHNKDVLISYGVTTDDKNPLRHILYFDQGGVAFNRDYFIKNDTKSTTVMSAYRNTTYKVAVAIGASEHDAKTQMEEMVDFEVELAEIQTPRSERRDSNKMYHKMTLGDMDGNSTFNLGFNYLNLIKELFQEVHITNITKDTECIVYEPEYLGRLSTLLRKTNTKIIHNYMIWRFARSHLSLLPPSYDNLTDEFTEAYSGVSVRTDRWKRCESYVNSGSLMGDVVGRLFINKYFNTQDKKNTKSLIADLRSTFDDIMSDSTWMDKSTKDNARNKLKHIDEKIAFDDKLLNSSYLDDQHTKWTFTHDHFNNVMVQLKEHATHNLKDLYKPVDRTKWTSDPAVVNAFYSPSRNRITFPAGILQPPFYGRNYPKALNYGGIGTVIGHEMSHGFDDSGKDFDEKGYLRSWWSSKSEENFNKKAECVINQYSDYVENGDHLKGKVTLGENIADNGGMKISYKAYEKYVKDNGEEKVVPGTKLSNRQLVFIGFAQSFCELRTPESMHDLIVSNEHAPGKFRILGVMQNHEHFAEQFSCKPGDRMYVKPEQRCSVW